MRSDGTFIAIEVDDAVASDAALAASLADVCPVDIYAVGENGAAKLEIVQQNVDECVLCRLCLEVGPAGEVRVLKLYDGEAPLE
jgi:NAD-dependent dihydropyrimidine dehydrogenase PreA subunit